MTLTCAQCGGVVKRDGHIYQLSGDHPTHEFMLVSDAACQDCHARYTAWVGPTGNGDEGNDPKAWAAMREYGFWHLVYRSTFSDVPGEKDVPYPVATLTFERIVRQGDNVISRRMEGPL